MLTGIMNAAPRPWTLLPPGGTSGGDPAGGGLLELASCEEGFCGSSGKRSSAMIYVLIIGFFAVDLGVRGRGKIGAEWTSTASLYLAMKLCRRQDRNPAPWME